jgi:hypothetical protein
MLLAMASGLTAGQQAGTGSVEGVVVRLGNGGPIAGVNVEMRRVEGTAAAPLGPPVFPSGAFSPGAVVVRSAPNPADIFRAQTRDDGRFVFADLKPGKYRLMASHPGGRYYPAEYGQRHPRSPGYDFVLDETQPIRVRLEMAPMASVSGRVIGADGRPAPHAHVIAAEVGYQNGQRILSQMQGVETDDRGDYRLFWLPPGQYYIGAFPEGLRRRAAAVPFGPPGAVESLNQIYPEAPIQYRASGGDVFEEVYETVYAPGETNLEFARLLDLRLGANLSGVDISLAAGRRRAMRVRGVVIDGTTSQPIPNVSVRMVPQMSGPVTFSPRSTTAVNGAFEIAGLMPGSYVAIATANPGRVTDQDGEPVVYSPVRILKVAYSTEGWLEPALVLSVTTNDLGEYRAFWLPPGQYLVNAGPAQLSTFGNQGMTNPANSDASIPTTFVVPSTRPRASPPPEDEVSASLGFASTLYYPDTPDVRSAEVINLAPGVEAARIDIRMSQPLNSVRLTGRVVDSSGRLVTERFGLSITDWPDATPFPLARVGVVTALVPATDLEKRARGAVSYVYVPGNGRFEGAAAPGVFQIRATQGEFSGRAIIDVGNRDLDVIVPLRPLTEVTGRVVVENTTSDALNLNGLEVAIRTAPSTQFTTPVGPDGSLRIERVIVGDYRVYVPSLASTPAAPISAPPAAALPPAFENAYVKVTRAGGVDVTNGLLRVEGVEPADPVEIVLSLRGASIEGRALNSRGEAASRATVVLLPEGQPPFRPDRQRTFTTSETGRFQFRGLPPGEYRVLAWEDVDAGAWFNPSFLNSYERAALRVQLAEGEHRDLAVSVIPAAP